MAAVTERAIDRVPHYRWLAEADGIGHAVLRGVRDAACGIRAPQERYAHPLRSRCPACSAEVLDVTKAALVHESESELRAAYGDR